MLRTSPCLAAALSLFLSALAGAQSGARLSVDATMPVSPVSPTLYGLMTEEINFSYDGGLYPELLRNPTVRHSWDGFEHWRAAEHASGRVKLTQGTEGPSAALARSMRLLLTGNAPGSEAGVSNEGYWGMAVRSHTAYTGSFYATSDGPNVAHARLVSDLTGTTLGEADIAMGANGWQRYSYRIETGTIGQPSATNHFELVFERPGNVELQLISLFPPTYHDRPNGLRIDLMDKLAAMRPNFLRLPGGNYLEGDTFAERFNWKTTIGPRVDRPGHHGPWNYDSTDGLGLLEFLEWCDDLHMQPVLAVFAGYSLKGEHVTGRQLEPFVQDDLDEIEYVTGDVSTTWGAQRAKDGHPAPFPLQYVEIGNEDEFDRSGSYDERFAQIAKAIRARYPQLKLIATTRVKVGNPDLIDDHFYETPEGFFDLVHKYDNVDRNGPKIFIGEWATREGMPTTDFGGALGDAAWMTSLERNSDLILMASYAPMLVNVNPGGMQWPGDMIGYDALTSYGSPSYWAQVLFAGNLGDHTVHTAATNPGDRFFWSATTSEKNHTLYLKLVNASDVPLPLTLDLNGVRAGEATVFTLHAASRWVTNDIEHPDRVAPVRTTVRVQPASWKHDLPPRSIEVLDVPLR